MERPRTPAPMTTTEPLSFVLVEEVKCVEAEFDPGSISMIELVLRSREQQTSFSAARDFAENGR
jgi:hypothetical protein